MDPADFERLKHHPQEYAREIFSDISHLELAFAPPPFASDPQEADPELGPIIKAAGEEAEAIVVETHSLESMGTCHLIWNLQKQILKERHGINWKCP